MRQKVNSKTSRYLSKIEGFPRLSREAEDELFVRWRDHADAAAKRDLINSNLRYSVTIASKYNQYGLSLANLICEGNLGVVEALATFDPKRGPRFVTYAAYWIRIYILNYIIRSWRLVNAGSGVARSRLFFRMARERSRILNLIGDTSATHSMLAARFGTNLEKTSRITGRRNSEDFSSDPQVFDGTDSSLLDSPPSPDLDQRPHSIAGDAPQPRRLAESSIATFDNSEQYVVIHRLVGPNGEELSLAEIGRIWACSRERTRQLEVRDCRQRRLLQAKSDESLGEPPACPAA